MKRTVSLQQGEKSEMHRRREQEVILIRTIRHCITGLIIVIVSIFHIYSNFEFNLNPYLIKVSYVVTFLPLRVNPIYGSTRSTHLLKKSFSCNDCKYIFCRLSNLWVYYNKIFRKFTRANLIAA